MFIHSRSRIARCLAANILFLALSVPAGAAAPAPCAKDATPWLTLRITAGAMSPESDRTTIVRIHTDGCTELHRPPFLRASGDYRLDLHADEVAALHTQVASDELRGFDERLVHAAIDGRQHPQGAPQAALKPQFASQPQRFAVMDGDRYELSWNDAGAAHSARWVGLSGYAQAYPDVAALQAFDKITASLRALTTRSDVVQIAADVP
jgi:hypothetical protein